MTIDALIGKFARRVMSFPKAASSATLPAARPGREYLLYLHIPYCVSLCPFCSFHRVLFDRDNAGSYFDSLRQEIDIASDLGYVFNEVYIGGGTPTVLPDDLIKTIEHLRRRHPIGTISVETNPNHLEEGGLQALRMAGVKRLSVGVQSFDDELLQEMGRYDTYGSGEEIVARLIRHQDTFETTNVDMIFNLPHQTQSLLQRDLDVLIERVEADQVSYYPLMAAASVRKAMLLAMGQVDHHREKHFYELIVERLLAAGYTRNSAWCFSRHPGEFDEYIVRCEEYVGLGSGAFSYLDGQLFAATFSIDEYQQLVAGGHTGTIRQRQLSRREQMRYHLLVTLFSGMLDKRAAEQQFDSAFQRTLWPELSALQTVGAVRDTGEFLSLTEKGFYLWVVLMREFFTGINSLRDQMKHDTRLILDA